jgi:type IV pilus assembly protein PilM
MAHRSKAKKKARVGLDIGNHSVKLVEVTEGGDRPMLTAIGMKKMLEQSKDATRDMVKLLAEECSISVKDVNISVSGPSVVVRLVSLPRMTEDELKSAIKFEAEKFIPFNINDCIIDFQIVKKYDKENKLDVLLAAVKKGYVEDKIDIVEAAGLSVGLVDVDGFAVANAFMRSMVNPQGEKTFAILNMGAAITNLTILRENMACMVRDMPVGSANFDACLSKGLGLDIKKAEELKLLPGARKEEVILCVRKAFNSLVDEMRLPFSYYENQFGRGVDEIVLAGGGSSFVGLEGMFQEAFGVKPVFFDPFQFLDTGSETINKSLLERSKNAFAVAVGLALR